MPLVRADPNYYSTGNFAAAGGSTGLVSDGFGFAATWMRFVNTNAVDFYVSLRSSTLCSTADMKIRACSELVVEEAPLVSVITGYTTSTGATAPALQVTALG